MKERGVSVEVESGQYSQGLFSHAQQTEEARLRALERLCDPVTEAILDEIGVQPTWRCLELGGGAGSMARELARRCPGGRVVVTDLDAALLRGLPDGVEVLVHDVTRDSFPPASFDLIHIRAVLMHLSDPAVLVSRITQWLAPGGWLVVEDPTMFPADSSEHPLLRKVMDGFERILAETMGSDSRWGRRLPTALAGAGLEGIRMVSTQVMVGDGGPGDDFWRATLPQSTERFTERGLATAEEIDALLSRFGDPDFLDISFAVTSAWGRRPSSPRASAETASAAPPARRPIHMTTCNSPGGPVLVDGHGLTLTQVAEAAAGPTAAGHGLAADARKAMARSCEVRNRLLASGEAVYGVTTGFGDSSGRQIGVQKTGALQRNLLRFLRVGTGPKAPDDIVRATLLIRANSLARGMSGIREEPVAMLLALLDADLLPVVPERGSVGASGDLAPLSYVAAALLGEGLLRTGGDEREAAQVLREHGLSSLELEAKEGLALVNGTAFMSAFAALAHTEAAELAWVAELCTALAVQVRSSPPGPFQVFPHAHKPHPAQVTSAAAVARLLEGSPSLGADRTGSAEAAAGYAELNRRVQDPYSLRCAPHVVGVLRDTLDWAGDWITTEINSSNDNPLFDPESGQAHNSGNFYGGHIAHAAQALTTAAASVADLLDRQLQLFVDEKYSLGLPANLIAAQGAESGLHHGLKGAQIAASALTAEALHLTTPAGSFSRSTEAHNQDKVSMGTIAARHARTAVGLATEVAAVHLLALVQAVELRDATQILGPGTRGCFEAVREVSAGVAVDRPLDGDIADVATLIRSGELRQTTSAHGGA